MINDNNEITIRMADLCAAFLRAFKPILALVLILGLLGAFLGMRGTSEKKPVSGSEQLQDAEAALSDAQRVRDEAEAALSDAQRVRDEAEAALDRILEIEIPTAETEIQHRESLARGWRDYMENSLWYSLDPFHLGVSRVTVLLESEAGEPLDLEEIIPEATNGATIAYSKITPVDLEMLESIRQIMQVDVDLAYINELINVTVISQNVIEIRVCFEDPAVAKQATDFLLDRLQTQLAQREDGYSAQVVGEYSGYEVNTYLLGLQNNSSKSYTTAISDLQKAEQALQNLNGTNRANAELAVSDANAAVAKAEAQLQKLQDQADDGAVGGTRGSLKKALRYGLLFSAIGLFLSCVIVFLGMVFSGKLQNVNCALTRYAFPVIGILPGKKKRWFDKTICRLEGEPYLDYESAGRAAAQSLLSVVGERHVALISSEGDKLIQAVLPFVDEKIPVCGDLLKDAEAVKAAGQYDGFVLVEAKGQSHVGLIDAEVRRVHALGKQVEGMILL